MSSKIYIGEDGKKKVDVRMWDTLHFITEIHKSDRVILKFYAAVRDGIRYVHVQEFTNYRKRNDTQDKFMPTKRTMSVPLYMPIENGTKMSKPFIDFIKAFQQVVEAHKDVPIEDPETRVVRTKTVYTEKERREFREKENSNEQ